MSALEEIKPTHLLHIMDLVAEAGLDVSDWSNFKGGPSKARANPRYCYEWAFISHAAVVITLWFIGFSVVDGVIERRINLKSSEAIEANSLRKGRRQRMRRAIESAYAQGLPVRVIVVDGNEGKLGRTSGKVERRKLDPVPWAVVHVASDGEIVLRRGVPAAELVDQFSRDDCGSDQPEYHSRVSTTFGRDPEVRRRVLLRAMGLCEYCKTPGFKTNEGAIYLETHHVVPMSEAGADKVSNVAALCPNHHREAHYGAMRETIRGILLGWLQSPHSTGQL